MKNGGEMNMKHTPGPWEVHSRQPTFIRANGGRKHIASTASMGDDEESRANARLIAAAPDLLVALENLVAAYVETVECETGKDAEQAPEVVQARAAIAKTTGSAA